MYFNHYNPMTFEGLVKQWCNEHGYNVVAVCMYDVKDKAYQLQVRFEDGMVFDENLGDFNADVNFENFMYYKLRPYLDPWVQYPEELKCSESTSTTELVYQRTIVCTSGKLTVREQPSLMETCSHTS